MKKLLPLLSFLALLSFQAAAQKIVGYLPSYRDPSTTNIQYNKLTTVIYAFINPNTTGNLITTNVGNAAFDFSMTHFLTVKNNCSSNGVELAISLGGADAGGQRSSRLNSVCGNATYRATLVSELVNFAITHNLAEIDIDWEFPTTTTAKNRHELLLQELDAAIAASANPNIRIGVAVGGEYTGAINHLQYFNDNAVQYVDDFHIMAYDFPASYNANHASLTDAQNSVTQWNATKGVPLNKMYLGVPFYGRNSSRTLESEYNVFSASNPSGAYNSATDLMSGYYYNAKATLETKTEWIMNQGGQGIMIWDLGQDRTDQYSLLSAIYNKMATLCPAPQPDLGPDVGFCTGSVTLDSDVPTAAGRTFTWKKDGATVVSNSSTATTYEASDGGIYTVEVTQSGCTKSDVIEVTEGSSLSVTGASRCGPGSVTLTVNNTGGTYDWYDASTGGTLVHTGQTYSPSVTSTTTYYVQENTGSATYNGGKAVINVPSAWNEAAYDAANGGLPRHAHKIVVSQNLTIESVKIWTSGHALSGVKVMVISSINGTTVSHQTTGVNLPASSGPHTLSVNITLVPGTYYVGVMSSGVEGGTGNPGVWLEPNSSYPTSQSGVYSIEGNSYINWGGGFNASGSLTAHYGQLFDWVITTGVAPPCGRTAVTATINSAANTGVTVSSTSPICSGTDGTISITTSENGVSYQPFIGTNTAGTAVNGTGGTINLTVNAASLSIGSNTITVKATKTGCGTVDLTTQPTITVNTVPAQPSIISGGATVCTGSENYSVTNVAGVTYAWSVSGGGTISGAGNSISVNWTSAGNRTLTCTPSNTCGNGTARDLSVTVNAVPSQPSTITGNTSICPGSENYSVTNVAGVTYAWSVSGGGTISGSGNSISVNWTSAGNHTLTCTPSNTCGNGTARDLSITVNDVPAQPSTITGNTSICPGSENYSVTNVAGVTYAWSVSGGGTISGSGNSISVNWTSAGNHTLTCTPSNTCGNGTARDLSVTVSDIPSQPGNFTTSSSAVTKGQTGVIYTVPSVAGASYNWSYSGTGATINGSGNSITVDFSSTATSGTLSVTATNTCGTSASSRDIAITVNDPVCTPQPGDFTASSASVTQGQTGVVYTVPNVGGTSYTWSYSGTGATINGSGNSVTVDFSASATDGVLSVTANDGSCPSTPRQLSVTVSPLTAVQTFLAGSSIDVYPNPFQEYSVVSIDLSAPIEADLEVYNVMGLKVLTLFKNQNLSSGNHRFELTDIPSGTYIVKLKSGSVEKYIKVVKN